MLQDLIFFGENYPRKVKNRGEIAKTHQSPDSEDYNNNKVKKLEQTLLFKKL